MNEKQTCLECGTGEGVEDGLCELCWILAETPPDDDPNEGGHDDE